MPIFNAQSITLAEEALLWRQFALLYKAGVNIALCCDLLADQQQKAPIRQLMQNTKAALLNGKALSQSLRTEHPKLEEMTYKVIELGEHSGKLDELLLLLVRHQEARVKFKKQLLNALLYPCILCVSAVIVLFCLLYFVLPRFAELFANANIALPWMTRILLNIASFSKHHALMMLLCLCCGLLFFNQITPNLRLPIVYPLRKTTFLAQFSRHLALALQAGLNLAQAIGLSLPDSKEANDLALAITTQLEQGNSLQKTLASTGYFPPLALQLVKIGEETGQLEHWLLTWADYLELDLLNQLEHIRQLLEPLIMLILGVVIGGLVICLYLPLFNLGNAF